MDLIKKYPRPAYKKISIKASFGPNMLVLSYLDKNII